MSKEMRTLSPLPYIKNNRGRVMGLVISMALFGMMVYTLGYFLGTIREPFDEPVLGPLRYMTLLYEDVTEYADERTEETDWEEWAKTGLAREAEVLAKDCGQDVIVVRQGVYSIDSSVGNHTMPLVYFENTDDMQKYIDKLGCKLVEGRLPQKPGELLAAKKTIINCGDELNAYISKDYKVVGQVDSDYYLLFGLPLEEENNFMCAILHDDDGVAYDQVLTDKGHELEFCVSYKTASDGIATSFGSLDQIRQIFTYVSVALLLICVTVVFSLHILDRHEEWCLLNSIGFSVADIYKLALKETLVCMGIAFAGTTVLTVVAVFAIKTFICDPRALSVRELRPEDLLLVLEGYLTVFGFLQIPIFSELRKITTVDDIE